MLAFDFGHWDAIGGQSWSSLSTGFSGSSEHDSSMSGRSDSIVFFFLKDYWLNKLSLCKREKVGRGCGS